MACVNHPDREAAAVCVVCGDELCAECRQVGPDGKSYCSEHLPVEAAQSSTTEMPPQSENRAQPPPVVPGAAAVPKESTGLAAACYFSWIVTPLSFILPVIPLASADMKQSSYMRYHAFNGLFWGLAVIVGMVALQIGLIFAGVLGIPHFLMVPLRLLRTLWGLIALVASIVFAVRAANRQPVRIPLVSDLADSQMR